MYFTSLRSLLVGFSLFVVLNPSLSCANQISSSDERIIVTGSLFQRELEGVQEYLRFSLPVLNGFWGNQRSFSTERARTPTGVILKFATASPSIILNFKSLPSENRGREFAVYRDGELWQEITVPTTSEEYSIQINVSEPFGVHVYEVSLPSWSNAGFVGMELSANHDLETVAHVKVPKLAVLGDSISHGTGQGAAAYKSWPFIFSRLMNWELYNLSVGGARTSSILGNMLEGLSMDHFILFTGYNDWNGENDIERFEANMTLLVERIRGHFPNAMIYCITISSTTTLDDGKDHSAESYRQVVREIVSDKARLGDERIFTIEGEDITTLEDLADRVHLSIAGARNVALKMQDSIQSILNSSSSKGLSWIGFPLDEHGYVDTGAFLGEQYSRLAPWHFNESLLNWLYIPENQDINGGAWVFSKN